VIHKANTHIFQILKTCLKNGISRLGDSSFCWFQRNQTVVTFTRNCLQTPSHMLKLQAMHGPLDSCGQTPLSRITFTLSQQLKSSQNKIFSAMKNPHTLSLYSVSTASFLYLNWHIHKADVVHGLEIKLWNPFFSQSHAEHSCNWVTSWFVDSNFIFRF